MKTPTTAALAISAAMFGVVSTAQAQAITLELNGCKDTVLQDTIRQNNRSFVAVSACGQFHVMEFTGGKLQTVLVQPVGQRTLTMEQVLIVKGLIPHPNYRERRHGFGRDVRCRNLEMAGKPFCNMIAW